VVDIKLKKTKKADKRDSFIKIIPLALILFLVPMIVYCKVLPTKGIIADITALSTIYDFFNYYKVFWLIVFTVCSIISVSCYAYVKKLKIKLSFGFIPLFVYYLFVFLSASYSQYKDVAFNGYSERYEGFWTISCYVIICIIAAHFITYDKDIKLLFGALAVCTTLLCILGVFQFLGFDFLQTDFMKKMMLPSENYNLIDSLDFKFPYKITYLTLFNPNYVGSFCSMSLPISLVTLLLSKKKSIKVFSGILSCLILVNLAGSRSSAGIVGAFAAVLVLVILLRKELLKYWAPILGLAVCCSGVLIYYNFSHSGAIVNQISEILPHHVEQLHQYGTNKYLTDLKVEKDTITIDMIDIPLILKYNSNSGTISFTDKDGKAVESVNSPTEPNSYAFASTDYAGLKIKIVENVVNISAPNAAFNVQYSSGAFKLLSPTNNPIEMANPPHIGFEGYERWASSRGYIWSRSLPLVKDTILLGHGPDTFAIYFPQNDLLGKLEYLDTPYLVVDKPHNMFLQIAINTGVVSLLAFLVFILWYIINSFRLYFKPKKDDSFYYMAGSACVLSVIGFLVAGLANDSNATISPIFWLLLGIGLACNKLYSNSISAESTQKQQQPKIKKHNALINN
jgi:hypothetical protein